MQYAIGIASCVATIGLVKAYPWLNTKYSQFKTAYSLLSNLNNAKNEKPSFEIIGNCALIRYTYMGTQYELLVPYSREKVIPMMDIDLTLVSDESSQQVNFQPGIPILVSAQQLNIKCIRATNTDTNISEEFVDEVPHYLYRLLTPEE